MPSWSDATKRQSANVAKALGIYGLYEETIPTLEIMFQGIGDDIDNAYHTIEEKQRLSKEKATAFSKRTEKVAATSTALVDTSETLAYFLITKDKVPNQNLNGNCCLYILGLWMHIKMWCNDMMLMYKTTYHASLVETNDKRNLTYPLKDAFLCIDELFNSIVCARDMPISQLYEGAGCCGTGIKFDRGACARAETTHAPVKVSDVLNHIGKLEVGGLFLGNSTLKATLDSCAKFVESSVEQAVMQSLFVDLNSLKSINETLDEYEQCIRIAKTKIDSLVGLTKTMENALKNAQRYENEKTPQWQSAWERYFRATQEFKKVADFMKNTINGLRYSTPVRESTGAYTFKTKEVFDSTLIKNVEGELGKKLWNWTVGIDKNAERIRRHITTVYQTSICDPSWATDMQLAAKEKQNWSRRGS